MRSTDYSAPHYVIFSIPITSSLLGPNTLLNTLFSNTLSRRSTLNVSDEVFSLNNTLFNVCILAHLAQEGRTRDDGNGEQSHELTPTSSLGCYASAFRIRHSGPFQSSYTVGSNNHGKCTKRQSIYSYAHWVTREENRTAGRNRHLEHNQPPH